jgi:hypothetical protein
VKVWADLSRKCREGIICTAYLRTDSFAME